MQRIGLGLGEAQQSTHEFLLARGHVRHFTFNRATGLFHNLLGIDPQIEVVASVESLHGRFVVLDALFLVFHLLDELHRINVVLRNADDEDIAINHKRGAFVVDLKALHTVLLTKRLVGLFFNKTYEFLLIANS